jgi:hypothetical protein
VHPPIEYDDPHEEGAREYLIRSSQGQKFELERLPLYKWVHDFNAPDDGIEDLMEDEPEILFFDEEFDSLPYTIEFEFEERTSNPLVNPTRLSGKILLLTATPRDFRGHATVCVYQDFELVGWLHGPDLEELAIHLIDNHDFGTARVPFKSLASSLDARMKFAFKLPNRAKTYAYSNPATITNPHLVSPSNIQWLDEPAIIELPRNVQWGGCGFMVGTVTNKYLVPDLQIDETGGIAHPDYPGSVYLVPDIWQEGSTKVFIYFGDLLVGQITETTLRNRLHDLLCGYSQRIAHVRSGAVYGALGVGSIELDAEIRPILRIDWDEAVKDLNAPFFWD